MLLNLTKTRIAGTLVIAAAIPLVIVACGGGGGAPANSDVPQLSTAVISNQQVTITDKNAPNVANNASFTVKDGANSSNNQLPAAAEISKSPSKQSILKLAKSAFSNIEKNKSNGNSVLGATTSCPGGGSITLPDIIPTAGSSINGTFDFIFSNCKNGTSTVDGSFSFTGTIALDAIGNPTGINATFTFNNFTFSDVGQIGSIDGGFKVVMTTSLSGVDTFSFTGKRLTFRDNTGAFELVNPPSFTEFNITYTSDTSTNVETFDVNYNVSSTFVGGNVSVITNVPFEGLIGTPYPYKGQMTVTGAALGASNSKVRLTAIDANSVMLEVDTTGNGTYDFTKTLNWTDL